ncbi:dnaJ homolog subfamily C member 30, mitochondrial-like [Anthonomus grandis grandis]|uniref:dnaJ homolog subfamily C member 30, mitochondrial-like n=1 Tax=Anthonomus grandis grandis TaxID=2921223 RepID=UPI00216522E3|nr:dnaJ homolog subfamily C member 30, mitochondrial-like [Anthonomus grandis grandis]XP_050302447.1 dnaJ homolog subfamily C member 30, mitochondrial-like [Anthonomus grandis grandis]
MNYKLTMFMLVQARRLSRSAALHQKNHYNSLGIGKTATQAEIKNAYYNLSKVYHPDKNQGHTSEQRDAHSQKFQDISEAYEVLGNITTRKLYDKGFLSNEPSQGPAGETTPDDPLHRFYKSREMRSRPPPPSPRQTVYNFDEWSRMHYSESVKRATDLKNRRAARAAEMQLHKEAVQEEKCFFAMLGIFCLLASIYEFSNWIQHIYNQIKENKYPFHEPLNKFTPDDDKK